jgi:hypothetical protein
MREYLEIQNYSDELKKKEGMEDQLRSVCLMSAMTSHSHLQNFTAAVCVVLMPHCSGFCLEE